MDILFKNLEDTSLFRLIVDRSLDSIISHQQNSSFTVMEEDNNILIDEIKELLKTFNYDSNNMKENLLSRSYSLECVDFFIKSFAKRRTDLILASITQHNSKFGNAVLDWNWKVKLVLGTSALHELNYPVVELNVKIINSNSEVNTKTFEFTKEELGKLINILET